MDLKFKNNFLGYFNFYYKVVGNKIFIYLILSIIISFLDGMGLAMFMPLLQIVGDGTNKATGKAPTGMMHYLTDGIQAIGLELNLNTILVFLVTLFALKGAFKFYQQTYQVNLRHYFIKKIRYHLVDNLEQLSYTGFIKLDAGNIQNTLTAEVQRLFLTMSSYFAAAQAIVMLGTYVFLAFLANYQFALFIIVGTALSNFLYRRIYKSTKKASLDLSNKGGDFNSLLVQAVFHFKYLKSTNHFKKYASKLRRVVDETEVLTKKMGMDVAITSSSKEPMIIAIVCLVIFVEVSLMHAKLSSILLSLLLFYRALAVLMIVQMYWQLFIQNLGGIYTISEISSKMTEMKEANGSETFTSFDKTLVMENISFYYGEKQILDNINITIPKNSTIALVGESGSGKTTLANMIAGLLKPKYGDLLLDDKSLTEYDLSGYRDLIGYISQEPVIFNDSIFNNITFWANPTPENNERFREIIKLTSLADFIEEQPEKEFTILGDNGILISGGQKQRISIARELFKKTEILILDEATSALDSETEKIIQDNIEKLHGSYTMIIIAHRLSTIKKADQIYLLEKGKLINSGTFSEMFDSSEKFKRMVTLQGV